MKNVRIALFAVLGLMTTFLFWELQEIAEKIFRKQVYQVPSLLITFVIVILFIILFILFQFTQVRKLVLPKKIFLTKTQTRISFMASILLFPIIMGANPVLTCFGKPMISGNALVALAISGVIANFVALALCWYRNRNIERRQR
jgi:cytochrome bd-type quinol oxidase subunit 2